MVMTMTTKKWVKVDSAYVNWVFVMLPKEMLNVHNRMYKHVHVFVKHKHTAGQTITVIRM